MLGHFILLKYRPKHEIVKNNFSDVQLTILLIFAELSSAGEHMQIKAQFLRSFPFLINPKTCGGGHGEKTLTNLVSLEPALRELNTKQCRKMNIAFCIPLLTQHAMHQ